MAVIQISDQSQPSFWRFLEPATDLVRICQTLSNHWLLLHGRFCTTCFTMRTKCWQVLYIYSNRIMGSHKKSVKFAAFPLKEYLPCMYLCLWLSVWLYSYRLNWWVSEVYIHFNIGHTLRPVHHTITCLACFIKSLNKSISLINLSRLSMKLSVICLMVGGVLQSVGAGQPHDHLFHVIIPLTISY